MFGSKKKKVPTEGIQARAVVINVQDTEVTINDNPRVKLTLQVQPEGDVPFEVSKKTTVSRVSIPRVGDEYFVRYDPADTSNVEFRHRRGASGQRLGRDEGGRGRGFPSAIRPGGERDPRPRRVRRCAAKASRAGSRCCSMAPSSCAFPPARTSMPPRCRSPRTDPSYRCSCPFRPPRLLGRR